MITYKIPLRGLKVSGNKIYEGIHWARRKEIADSFHSVAAGFCRPVQNVGSYPVELSYRFFFTGKALDTTNCFFMAKMLEDALRAIGVLEDDDPLHVARTVIESFGVGKKEKEDWVEIKINNI